MKLAITNTLIAMNFETEGIANVEIDVATLPDAVKHQAMVFGFQTALRNATAGKLEEINKAVESVNGRINTWKTGAWQTQAEAKAAITLSDDERSQVVARVIVMARKAKGDTRSDSEILTAFNALDEARKAAVVASLQKPIDKQIKNALREKKLLSKSGGGADF